jgi:hypothetical protein
MTTNIEHRKCFDDLKKALNKFQESLHLPEDEKKGEGHANNHVSTVFFTQYRRTTWYYHFPEQLEFSGTENRFVFRANAIPHGLLNTNLCQTLPSIVCNQGYKARWTHNVGSNVMENGVLAFNDTLLQTLDYVSVDMNGQSVIDSSLREDREINLGNITKLTEWNTVLPSYPTIFKIPWFYALEPSSYFPLYLCGFLDRVEHRLTLRRDVANLLHVQNEDGKRVLVDKISIKFIDGKAPTETPKMPMPVMWGDYLFLHDIECAYNRRCVSKGLDSKSGSITDQRNVLYIDDIIAEDSDNPVRLNNTVAIKINNSKFPVHSFAWVAQNETALRGEYYSNYSTDPTDHRCGWSPFKDSTLSTGKDCIFKDFPSYMTERGCPSLHYRGMPKEPGYNFWTLAIRAHEYCPKPGIIIKDGQLSVRLKDMNAEVGLVDGQISSEDLFRVRLRMTYTKRVVFTKFPVDEHARSDTRALCEIQGTV